VVPNGLHQTERQYQENRSQLPQHQADALLTIETLQLNCSALKTLREKITADTERVAVTMTPQQAQAKIQRLNFQNPLSPFVEVVIHILQKRR
jgi:hypothetical protein